MHIRNIIIPIGPSIAYVPLTRGLFSLIDRDDIPLVENRNWYAHAKPIRGFYAAYRVSKGPHFKMHNVLKTPPDGLIVDHANGDGLDNRRTNIRICKHRDNFQNKRTTKRGDVPKGVYLNPRSRTYRAQITANGRRIYIGNFPTIEMAEAAYKEAATQHFGAFFCDQYRSPSNPSRENSFT